MVAVTVTSLFVGGCSSDDSPEVVTAEVTAGEVVQTVAAPAHLEPRDRRVVTATVPGIVEALLVDPGQRVDAGEPIVRLSSDSVDAAIAQADAAVEAAGALSGVTLSPDLSPVIASVRDQLEATLAPLISSVSAQANAIEDPQLREQALRGVATLVNTYETTRERLRTAEQEARAASARASAPQRAAAEAQRDQAERALEAAEQQRDELELVAPIDGVVEFATSSPLPGGGDESGLGGLLGGATGSSSGPLSVGSVVAPGQALFTVYDLGGFHAVATVDEIDVVLVAEGQRAEVLVDAFPDLVLPGVVRRVAVAPGTTSAGGVVYDVDVTLTRVPSDVTLRIGLTASAEIVVARVDSDRVVPASALRRRDGDEVVLVARDGVVDVVPVTVTALGSETAAVEGELSRGERVVTAGADDLDDGDRLP